MKAATSLQEREGAEASLSGSPGPFDRLGQEGYGELGDAGIGEDAAMAEPRGPMQPHMVACGGICPRVIGRYFAIVGRVDEQRRRLRQREFGRGHEGLRAAGR